jgi:hypothetical protein
MDITRTIPQTEDPAWVESFFGGPEREEDWPFSQRIANVEAGDFLYLIYQGRIVGRFEVVRIRQLAQTRPVPVGTDEYPVEAKTIVYVRFPGERALQLIERRGHRNHRYYDGSGW